MAARSVKPELVAEEKQRSVAVIDLRSDTVTKPTAEMRRAMAEAEVGDDVYGEDPTVNRLEQRAAQIFERESALFVPTGTMGNQIAIKVHTRPGQEVICEERAHIINLESATIASFAGCMPRAIYGEDGVLTWTQIKRRIAPKVYYRAQTGLIVLENTTNLAGGTIFPQEDADEICARAHEMGLPVHLDGARIFNAAAATGKSVSELSRSFDSVMFCLSKGLAAPVGSILAGSKAFIDQARGYRKAMGGGMRQAGILAAAGLVALEKMPARLREDHDNARFLAEGLSRIRRVKIDPAKVPTNILVFDISETEMDAADFNQELAKHNVLGNAIGPDLMRFVTHKDVSREDCLRTLEVMREICKTSH